MIRIANQDQGRRVGARLSSRCRQDPDYLEHNQTAAVFICRPSRRRSQETSNMDGDALGEL